MQRTGLVAHVENGAARVNGVETERLDDMTHDAMPGEVTAAIALMEGLLAYRQSSAWIGKDRHDDAGYHHVAGDLDGNLGRLVFVQKTRVTGQNWISPSFRAWRNVARQAEDQNDFLISPLEDGQLHVSEPSQIAPTMTVIPATYPAEDGRDGDSEYLLVNTLAHVLSTRPDKSGRLYLVTERLPCSSCSSVICAFLRDHPAVRLDLYYLLDASTKRSDCDLHREMRGFNVHLHKLVFDDTSGTLHLIPNPAPSVLSTQGLFRLGIGPIELDVAEGCCVSLMGASGAGKSVLLRMIADLDPHDGGAWLGGLKCSDVPAPAWRRQVTYVAADSGWWMPLVGSHFVRGEARPSFEAVGMADDIGAWSVSRLSTGEKQRLALLRALHPGLRVLLLDEPTSGLDAASVALVEALLRKRVEEGLSILWVTHDREQARRVATRHLLLQGGRLEEDRS